MSRIGKYPVIIPNGVTVTVENNVVTAKGKLGELSFAFDDSHVATKLEDNKVVVTPLSDSKEARTLWGTTRAQINSLVKGVSEGFKKELELVGVGYKARVEGSHKLVLSLGFSHDVIFEAPKPSILPALLRLRFPFPVPINNSLVRLPRKFASIENLNLTKAKALNIPVNMSAAKKVRRNKD